MTTTPLQLNPDDPFESAIASMVALNRRKRADYALADDAWSNFRQTADRMRARGHAGFDALESVVFNMEQKMVRLAALKSNDREPSNEAVADTWGDLAVYALIGQILAQEAANAVTADALCALEPRHVRKLRIGDVLHVDSPEPPHTTHLTDYDGDVWAWGSAGGWCAGRAALERGVGVEWRQVASYAPLTVTAL